MSFHPDDSGMRLQGQDGPVAKMAIQGDQNALVGDGLSENVRVIRPARLNPTSLARTTSWPSTRNCSASSTRNIWSRKRRTKTQSETSSVISELTTLASAKRRTA